MTVVTPARSSPERPAASATGSRPDHPAADLSQERMQRREERELLPMCADMGVGLVPYSPQGKGRLARPWGEQSHRSTVDVL